MASYNKIHALSSQSHEHKLGPLQVAVKETLYRLVNVHILMNTNDNIPQLREDGYK